MLSPTQLSVLRIVYDLQFSGREIALAQSGDATQQPVFGHTHDKRRFYFESVPAIVICAELVGLPSLRKTGQALEVLRPAIRYLCTRNFLANYKVEGAEAEVHARLHTTVEWSFPPYFRSDGKIVSPGWDFGRLNDLPLATGLRATTYIAKSLEISESDPCSVQFISIESCPIYWVFRPFKNASTDLNRPSVRFFANNLAEHSGIRWDENYVLLTAGIEAIEKKVEDTETHNRPAPAWERLKIKVSNGGDDMAILDGQSYRLTGSRTVDFLRLLQDARGELIQGQSIMDITGERPDRTYERLPHAIKQIISKPGKGKTGYSMR